MFNVIYRTENGGGKGMTKVEIDTMNGRTAPASRFSIRPLYLQVRDALAQRIASAEWKPGAVIPNEMDLAREFGVSPGTIRKAMGMLEEERLLSRRQGRGTFINDQSSAELAVRYVSIRAHSGEPIVGDVRDMELSQGVANESECRRLKLRTHERVYRLRRVRLCKGEPFMVEDSSMPATLFPGLHDKPSPPHRVVVLAQQYGILLGKAEERISIAEAPSDIAQLLQVPSQSPLMALDRVLLALDGRPVEWRVGHCHLVGMHYVSEIH